MHLERSRPQLELGTSTAGPPLNLPVANAREADAALIRQRSREFEAWWHIPTKIRWRLGPLAEPSLEPRLLQS